MFTQKNLRQQLSEKRLDEINREHFPALDIGTVVT